MPADHLTVQALVDVPSSRDVVKDAAQTSQRCPVQPLPFVPLYTDGGAFAPNYGCVNLLRDDMTCYSTAATKREDVNILLSLPNHDSFTLTRIDIRAPAIGYTSPLGQGLVFVGWNPPTPEHTRAYDNVRSCEEYQQTLRQQINMKGQLDDNDAVLFFDLGDYFHTSVVLDVARAGRYVLIKLLRPRNMMGDNVDVQYIGLCGWQGQRGFTAADVC